MHQVKYEWIQGRTYEEIWQYQTTLHRNLIDAKKKYALPKETNSKAIIHHLLLCQHHPVYTLGRSGEMSNLLLGEEELSKKGIEFYKINRGGDITYHGPGQITGYPVFDLDDFYTDVHRYVRELEEVIIKTLQTFQIEGVRLPKYTGVWVPGQSGSGEFKKICAIGVHLSRWVTLHGFAFNVGTDLSYFDHIIPCGIQEKNLSVTSIEKEIGQKVDMKDIEELLKANFAQIFDIEYL